MLLYTRAVASFIGTMDSLANVSLTLATAALIFSPGVMNARLEKSWADGTQQRLQQAAVRTLKEVLEGPLRGRRITVLMDVDVEQVVSVDTLLTALNTDLHIARTGVGDALRYNMSLQVFHRHLAVVEEDDLGSEDDATNPPVTDTLVALVNTHLPWPLETPPRWWISSTLLFLNLNLTCHASTLFHTRLAQQTPSVVLLCPGYQGKGQEHDDKDLPNDNLVTKNLAFPDYTSQNYFLSEDDLVSSTIDPSSDSFEQDTLVFRTLTWLPYDPEQKLVFLGPWNSEDFRSYSDLFYDRFQSFEGTTLHVSSDDDDAPLLFLNDEREFEGTCKRILDVLSGWLNFTFTLTHGAPDSKWGEIENGTWVGLLGEVYRGHKDLAINYFTITHERTRYFDTSISYHTEGFGFALSTPPELPRWRNLVYPFTWLVWAVMGGVLLTCGVTFYILTHLQPHHPDTDLFVSMAYVMKGLVNQSHTHLPTAWSLRLFLAGWWITAYVMVISYTCNLIAVLTVPVYPTRIHTLQELADSNYRLCMLDYGEFVPDALATSSDAEMRKLGGKMDLVAVTEEGYYGQEDCATLVLDNKNAHTETFAYLQLTYSDMGLGNKVYFMKEQIYEGNLAFIFRKHTPWRHAFNKGLRRLIESGFIQKWQREIMEEHSRPQADGKGSIPRPLSLGHLQGAFFILVLGAGCAGLVFLLERRLGAAPAAAGLSLHVD